MDGRDDDVHCGLQTTTTTAATTATALYILRNIDASMQRLFIPTVNSVRIPSVSSALSVLGLLRFDLPVRLVNLVHQFRSLPASGDPNWPALIE